MLHTYHGTVNKDGTISLLEPVDLPEGFEVMVILDNDSYIELLKANGAVGYTEELREEIRRGQVLGPGIERSAIVIADSHSLTWSGSINRQPVVLARCEPGTGSWDRSPLTL